MTTRRGFLVLVTLVIFFLPAVARADVLDDLRDTLAERRTRLHEIERKLEAYRGEIAERREQATTLRHQIRIIESNVTALRLEMDKTSAEIEAVAAEAEALAEEIRQNTTAIGTKRAQIRETVRALQTLEADTLVEAFFKYRSLDGALVEARALERLQQKTQDVLLELKGLRTDLDRRETALNDLDRELKELRERQDRQRRALDEQQGTKQRLFDITKAQEGEFQKLLAAAAEQHKRAQAAIAQIEVEVRAELERRGLARLGGVGVFDWPIDPLFGISCGFHCPDYPYRSILGPHTGIDLPTNMGTPVRAVADGYVARAADSGGAGYSYVLILHGDNLSTVYGHISSIAVSDGQFISRGQVIGGTGGAPGTRGAGLSTGPHLHFEVRKDGIPVNPAGYLP